MEIPEKCDCTLQKCFIPLTIVVFLKQGMDRWLKDFIYVIKISTIWLFPEFLKKSRLINSGGFKGLSVRDGLFCI